MLVSSEFAMCNVASIHMTQHAVNEKTTIESALFIDFYGIFSIIFINGVHTHLLSNIHLGARWFWCFAILVGCT
ncbi:hypothetical protein XELAEV_18020937mg [Xenopus laevis]|uniref:Uncharacterized protein n=1 Tax=Xenopus laevis TaxID=8355 RepID=A0A974D8M0_XENLA|nr:hypothetical protein XELAEV_18020937mg [Xenopus laevis]